MELLSDGGVIVCVGSGGSGGSGGRIVRVVDDFDCG